MSIAGYNEAARCPRLYRWKGPIWCSGSEHMSRLVNTADVEKFYHEPRRYNCKVTEVAKNIEKKPKSEISSFINNITILFLVLPQSKSKRRK